MTNITPHQKLAILRHLAGGKGVEVVATIARLTPDEVRDVAKNHGYPDRDKLAWAADILAKKIEDGEVASIPESTTPQPRAVRPAPTPAPAQQPLTRPDEIRVLLNTAKGHPSKRIQAAADRIFVGIDKLKALIAEDEQKNAAKRRAAAEKAQARAEVERLEAELAKAKAKLRGKPSAPASPSAEPQKRTNPKSDHVCPDCGETFHTTTSGLRLHRLRAHEQAAS